MPIRTFSCNVCKTQIKTLKNVPLCCNLPMVKGIDAPATKFMEPTVKEKGKSKIKGINDVLNRRAKEHSKNNEWDDIIQQEGIDHAKQHGFLNDSGIKKKAIDEI